jgi:hypothetical protein
MADADPAIATTSYNELGTYRTVSSLAVLSFVLGLLSVLSFAPSWIFVALFPPAAVLFGLLGWRQVKGAPEVFTGLRLAKLGMLLGLGCAVASMGSKYLDSKRIGEHGRILTDRFVSKLRDGDTEGAFWLKFPREARMSYINKGPDEAPGELAQQYASFYAEMALLSQALAKGEGKLEFDEVEHAVTEAGTEYAAVVYTYRSPKEDMHILVVANSYHTPNSSDRTWFIREHKIGYEPHSYTRAEAAGHGHAH